MPGPKPLPGSHIEFLLSTRDQNDLLGDFLPGSSADDAAGRWRHVDVWAQASGRVSEYGLDERTQIAADQHDWERQVVHLVTSGGPPDGDEAVELAEQQRLGIERWYFTCPPELHREIIGALLEDASFRTGYDELASGTAEFLRTAVHANADRAARRA